MLIDQETYPRGKNAGPFKYVTEVRGCRCSQCGDGYRAVVGIMFPDRSRIQSRIFRDETFRKKDGTPINVEFPPRPSGPYGDSITVEWYSPEYGYEDISLSTFNDRITDGEYLWDL